MEKEILEILKRLQSKVDGIREDLWTVEVNKALFN